MGLFFFLGLLVMAKGTALFQSVQTNQWAVQVVRFCFDTDKSVLIETDLTVDAGVNTQMSWLTGQLAHCQQKEQEATLAWQQALKASAERLSLVRAAAPHNIPLAQFATSQYPNQPETFFWLGDAYVAAAKTTQATQAFETGLSLQPEHNPLAWMALGRLYEASDDWQGAVRAYDEACFHHEGDRGKNGCPNAGRLYLAHEQYDLAAQRFQESMAQIPDWQPAQLGYAQALLGLGQVDEAVPHLTFLAEAGNATAQNLLLSLQTSQTHP